ncbi:MAG: hypothetical protein IBX40_13120 [Methanosarcinales archaeon]|nr:hypothetical protein [Methanosarcinales archaeon]
MDKSRRRGIGVLIFSMGLIAILIGAMTDIYTAKVGVIIMLAIWFIGGAIAMIVFGGKEE